MADPALGVPPVPAPPPGLVNAAPGLSTTTPGVPPSGAPPSGAPVTSFNPASATAGIANSGGYEAKPFEVAPNATVASNLKNIIDSGSPLMQQAEANARAAINARGLANSSQAVTAGQSAVIGAALPIASADAATYDRAATNTTNAANQAAQFGAAAGNTAGLANAAGQTQTSQFNAGQTDAALSAAATASNQVALTAQQIAGTKDVAEFNGAVQKSIADLTSNTNLTLQDKQSETQKILADIQANTAMSVADKQVASQQAIAAMQSQTTEHVAQLQADTTLTQQEKANQAQIALAAMNNTSQQQIARINADTSLSIADKQAAIQKLVTGMNNDTAKQVQAMQNEGSLANIRANGAISTQLQVLGDSNKLLLQTNAGASQLYTQALTTMSNIQTNPNLSADQKTQALNNQVQQLTDGLQAMAAISGTPGVSSLLNFTNANDNATAVSLPPGTPNNVAAQAPAIQNLYATVLGRPADSAGLAYWAGQAANGMPIDQIRANMQASSEYQTLHPQAA